ncbi:YkgJ family cysteine cluster protein [Dechloromonas sp.]|uniref:YkgJ family cysteine cluster protein n=1 Tax=Dechloromonas sp. TaxID=1917218 RepID=UPI00286E29F4|nr:YkgJ family cysteine cluster protein [Dechloromonas sp.]
MDAHYRRSELPGNCQLCSATTDICYTHRPCFSILSQSAYLLDNDFEGKGWQISDDKEKPSAGGAGLGICTSCGACCATYPVTFSRQELDSGSGGWVPTALTENDPVFRRCAHMLGTRGHPRRCVALKGSIGVSVSCAIYDLRPSPCRDFAQEADAGRGDARCGDARRLHDLPPLKGSYDAFPL